MRLLLKISTEEELEAPVFPNFEEDVTGVIEQTMQRIADDIGGVPPLPTPNTDGAFSPEALMDALADIVQWAAEAAGAVGRAVEDILRGIADLGEVLVTDSIKAVLWVFDSTLFAMYRYFRTILMLNAYSLPFTDELEAQILGVHTPDLWVSKGNRPDGFYPAEEDIRARRSMMIEYTQGEILARNFYKPFVPPAASKIVEMPPVLFTAPYLNGARPEDFLEAPLGQDDMFANSALQTAVPDLAPDQENTFTATPKNFGGAIANSLRAILEFEAIGEQLILPNFDLDGDRGYAWPGWQVNPDPEPAPLDPTKPENQDEDHLVHVSAVPIID
jgi:hypothetical protein